MTLDERLKIASQSYADGYTCSQAVFHAFLDKTEIEPDTAMRLMEGFGGGFGGSQEVCGALSAATGVISCVSSNGQPGKQSHRREVYQNVKKACELFRREYGGVTCRDVLRGDTPKPFRCGMKVKDAVLIAHRVIEEENSGRSNA